MTYATEKNVQEINRLVEAGYDQFDPNGWYAEQLKAACDHWLDAWTLVKQLSEPTIRTYDAFDAAYPDLEMALDNWLADLEMHLHNVGLDEPRYFEERLRFVREQIDYFPDVDDNAYLNMRRAEGEALWKLNRQEEAEAVYQALVEKLPDHAWAYIGWADHYNWGVGRPTDYPRAEAILRQALDRPNLDDPRSVLERLVKLYEDWKQPEKIPPLIEQYEALLAAEREQLQAEGARLNKQTNVFTKLQQYQKSQRASLGRNDPCWCGSGKKYKRCHWKSDQRN